MALTQTGLADMFDIGEVHDDLGDFRPMYMNMTDKAQKAIRQLVSTQLFRDAVKSSRLHPRSVSFRIESLSRSWETSRYNAADYLGGWPKTSKPLISDSTYNIVVDYWKAPWKVLKKPAWEEMTLARVKTRPEFRSIDFIVDAELELINPDELRDLISENDEWNFGYYVDDLDKLVKGAYIDAKFVMYKFDHDEIANDIRRDMWDSTAVCGFKSSLVPGALFYYRRYCWGASLVKITDGIPADVTKYIPDNARQ